MNEQDLQKIAVLVRIGSELVELGVATVGRVKAMLASEGQDDQLLTAAIGRLDAAIARAQAEAGQ